MKQVKVKLPVNKSGTFATFLATNGMVTVLSWSGTDGFFESFIYAEIVMKDEQVEAFMKSEWANTIVKS